MILIDWGREICGNLRLSPGSSARTASADMLRHGRGKRDGAYHQGTAGWLLGPFALAHFHVYRDARAAEGFLSPMADHLHDHGVGSIAEIFDGDPPFTPRGSIAQAWSVAKTLRAWLESESVGRPGPC